MADDKITEIGRLTDPDAGAQGPEEALSVFRLVPGVEPSDSNWDSAPAHGEVVVRARSAADARIVAAEAELDFRDTDTRPGDGNTTDFASAFRNPRLYSVVEDSSGDHSAEGERGVLAPSKG